MGGKLNVFGLGSLGVNVDKNPINLEDGELTKSQNAIHVLTGSMGGLRKRRGLTKLNSVAAAGAILGAIGVPIGIGTAGNDGSQAGNIPAVDPTLRTLFQARHITSGTTGWNTTTDGFTTSPTTGGPDGFDAAATPRVPNNIWTGMVISATLHKYRALWSGRPMAMYKNRMYYAGNDYTSGSASASATATIRMYDGTTDYLIGRVPVASLGVMDIIVGGDNMLYFTLFISGENNNNTMIVHVYQLNPDTGAFKKMGSTFPISPESVRVPFTLCWYQAKLWTRTHGGGITATSQLHYFIRPDVDTDWTKEDPADSQTSCNLIFSYKGSLYFAIYKTLGTAALIRSRSALGVHATAKTVATVEGAQTDMASFGEGNGFGAAAAFGGNMYVSYWNQEGTNGDNTGDKYGRIYKFDGTTWTLVYGPAANHADCVPYNHAIVIGNRLYFTSAPARTDVNAIQRIIYTTDGTSWTSVGSVLDDASGGFLGGVSL